MAEVLSRDGEVAESKSRSPQERGREMANTYAKSKEKRAMLESAGSAVIPDFKYVALLRGEYGDDQITALEAEISRREARATMAPPKPKPSPFAEAAARPVSTAETSGNKSKDKKVSNKGVKKAIAIGLIAATGAGLAGAAGYQLGHNEAKDIPLTYELHQGTEADEDAEAMEQAESIDVSDQYAGHFANDEGTGYNERKSSRYAYGESLEDASEEEIMQELEHLVFHEPTLFAPLYHDLDDGAKLQFTLEDGTEIDTSKMTPEQLSNLMSTNEEAHRIMGIHYLNVIGQYQNDTLNGRYANVYGHFTANKGEKFDSSNVEAVHCYTTENGSKAITFRYEIPGKDGQYATTTLRLGCGLQVVRPEGPEAERIITSTPEIDPDKPDDPEPGEDEPGGGDEDQGKKPFTEQQVFDGGAGDSWDDDTTGPGSVGEKPSTQSTTQDMGGGGNTGSKPSTGSSESSKKPSQESQKATQETSTQKAPEAVHQEQKAAETQQKANDSGHKANSEAASKPENRDLSKEAGSVGGGDKDNDGDFDNPDDIPW